jgi:hypothetical protein
MHPEGSFVQNGLHATNDNWVRPRNGDVAYESAMGTQRGAVRSSPFKLPAEIHFVTNGFFARSGMRLYLQDASGLRTLDLRQRVEPVYHWRTHFWKIPPEWQGTTVILIAEANAQGKDDWMGLTAPKAGGEPVGLSLLRSTYRSILLIFLATLVLLPGVAATVLLSMRTKLDFCQAIAAIVCGSGIVSYLVFWAFLAHPAAGKGMSVILLLTSFGVIVGRRASIAAFPAVRETAACVGLALLVAVFYSSVGFLYLSDDSIGDQMQVRLRSGFMPPDNILPFELAKRLWAGESPRKPPLVAFWQGSDRPPLQSGVDLLILPLGYPFALPDLLYQLVSLFLQCIWVMAVWVLVRAVGLTNRYLVPILGFCIFGELCMFHSIYVWPKLGAAAMMLLGSAPAFRGKWTLLNACLAGTCLSLGLLMHTGVVFTIVPFLVFVLVTRNLPSWKQLAAVTGIALVLLLPWRWYQTVYDPPGDHLLKFSMTRAQNEPEIDRPFGELLRESYVWMSPASYVESKWADVETMFTGGEMVDMESGDPHRMAAAYANGSFFHLFWCLGLLNAGFVCRFFAKRTEAVRFADGCLWIVAGSMLLWIFVLYPPGATVVHQWSLASVLLLYVILAIYVIEGRPGLLYPLLGIQILVAFPLLVFAKAWLEYVPGSISDTQLDPGMATVALVAFLGIVYWGWRAKLQEIV